MHTQRPKRIGRSSNLPNRLILPDIPQLDLAVPAPRHKLPEPAALHVHVCDPLLVFAPHLDHSGLGLLAGVEDADSTVAVASAEDVAGNLVGGEGRDAGPGAGWDVVCADFGCGVPNADDFHVTCDEQFALALLPVEHQSGILGAGDEVGESAEGGDELDVLFGLVVAEDFDNAVGGASHEEGLVVFVDEARFVYAGALWVEIGKAGKTVAGLVIEDAKKK